MFSLTKYKFQIVRWSVPLMLLLSFHTQGQVNTISVDSIALDKAIKQVIETHPSLAAAKEALQSADARIELARSATLPTIDANASYSHLGPVQEITIPNMGTFQLFPGDNYSASLNYHETIYDFGRTKKNVEVEKAGKRMTEENIDAVRQKLAMSTTIAFYTLDYLQEAATIKKEEIKNLEEHLDFVRRKKETGSATQYEVLSTQVKLSTVNNQEVEVLAQIKGQMAVLNSLLGNNITGEIRVDGQIDFSSMDWPEDSLVTFAINNNDEIKVLKRRNEITQSQYQWVKYQNNPSLNAFASGGWKNGYMPNLNKLTANYVLGVAINVPIFDANRKKNNLRIIQAGINTNDNQMEELSRKISSRVIEASASKNSAHQKISQFTLQVKQAEDALALAKVSFKAGTITNMDLLDAETSVSESQLLLLKSKVDYAISIAYLKSLLGIPLY